VSLILEALRKLEREKPAPERGVVVMTSAAWADSRSGRGPWTWLALGLVGGVAAAAAFLEWRRPASPSMVHSPAPATAPVTVPANPSRPAPATLVASRPATARPTPRETVPTKAQAPSPSVATPVPVSESAPVATTLPEPAPKLPAPSRAPALVLQAITVQDGRPVVLINDRILREGDEFEGVRILRIGEAEVEIERDGHHEVLRF